MNARIVYRNALTGVTVLGGTFFFGGTGALVSFVNKERRLPHWNHRAWGQSILSAAGVEVETTGLEHADPNRSYIIMANHVSLMDIPVVYGALPIDFRWLAKKELFQIPFFGPCLKRAGHISVHRGNRASAMEALHKASENVGHGVCVFVFPEGTRSADGKLQDFKKGGFIMALESGVPILPVVISGTHAILPKGNQLITPGLARVRVLPPVETAGLDPEADKEGLISRVHAMMEDAYTEDCGKLP